MKKNNSFSAIAKPNHQTIKKLMDMLGNPQDDLKIIHVAGTNGKGSVCSYLQSILTSAGHKTGKFTSPHMLFEYERISIDGINISKEDFDIHMHKAIECARSIAENEDDFPTQFELWTCVAFSYFKKQQCDYVVLETGLGGKKDATNIIKNPIMTVITQIAADHTKLLGDSLEDIAKEKAGIIKQSFYGGKTVTTIKNEAVLSVIKDAAKNAKNELFIADIPKKSEYIDKCEVFDYKNIKGIKSRMLGTFQVENAAIAIECAINLKISDTAILDGIYNAKNIGRFEILSHIPTVIFDGAHNSNGMSALCHSLNKYFIDSKFNFIIAFMSDKDIDESLNQLKSNGFLENSVFYTVGVKNNKRAKNSEELYNLVKNKGFRAVDAKTIENALSLTLSDSFVTVICGSLYLYSDLIQTNIINERN